MDKSLVENIKRQLEDYDYGQWNLLKGEFNLYYEGEGSFFIRNFYGTDRNLKQGNCVELTKSFLEENEGKDFVMCEGNEPSFFTNSWRHFFAVFLEDAKEYHSLVPRKRVQYLRDANPLIIDPSFRKIGRMNDEGYKINSIIEKFDDYRHAFFIDGKRVPLFIQDNLLFSFTDYDGKMNVSIEHKYGNGDSLVIGFNYAKELVKEDYRAHKLLSVLERKVEEELEMREILYHENRL